MANLFLRSNYNHSGNDYGFSKKTYHNKTITIRQIFRAIALRIITIAKCLFLLSYPLIVIFDIHVQVTVLKLDPGIKVFFACWKMSFLYKFYHDRQI